jgi:hypothetical protein
MALRAVLRKQSLPRLSRLRLVRHGIHPDPILIGHTPQPLPIPNRFRQENSRRQQNQYRNQQSRLHLTILADKVQR